jgi:hypothetical protein
MEHHNRFLSAIAPAALVAAALAFLTSPISSIHAEQPSPRKVFVETSTLNQPWEVKMDFDNSERKYKVGDKMQVKVTSTCDGYLYVFNQDPSGEIECIFPNSFQTKNEVKAGKEITIGGDGKFNLRTGEPAGKELMIAIVTTQPLKAAKLDDLVAVQKGLQKRISYKQAKRIYVEAVTGDPDRADNQDSVDKIKDKFQRDNPDKYKLQTKEYSISQVEITTSPKD